MGPNGAQVRPLDWGGPQINIGQGIELSFPEVSRIEIEYEVVGVM